MCEGFGRTCYLYLSWKWRRQVCPKRRRPVARLYVVMTHNTAVLTLTVQTPGKSSPMSWSATCGLVLHIKACGTYRYHCALEGSSWRVVGWAGCTLRHVFRAAHCALRTSAGSVTHIWICCSGLWRGVVWYVRRFRKDTLPLSLLKIAPAGLSETSTTSCQTVRRHDAQYRCVNFHMQQNVESS